MHQRGYLKLEILWLWFLPKYRINILHDNSQTLLVKSGRDEYASLDDNDDMWIFNPKWEIIPSFDF